MVGRCIEKIASLYLNVSQQCNIVLVPNPFYVIMYTEKRRSVVSCKLPQQCCWKKTVRNTVFLNILGV